MNDHPFLLPPSPDVCQECARDHDPRMPHDASSLFFQYRWYYDHDHTWPTWRDAMAHCDDEMRALWEEALEGRGVDLDAPPLGQVGMDPLTPEQEEELKQSLVGLQGQLMCDPDKPTRTSPIPHDYEEVDVEYGSLADGGSYDVLKCRRCGRVAYSPMAD